MTSAGLDDQAHSFAGNLTATVRSVVPECAPFTASLVTDRGSGGERFRVHQDPTSGIPLSVGGNVLLSLKVEYFCCLDGRDRWLAVDESMFHVFA
ncbi:MAG: hypothetical protein ACRCYX_07700, partial [Dermatophilaceae bacterium]